MDEILQLELMPGFFAEFQWHPSQGMYAMVHERISALTRLEIRAAAAEVAAAVAAEAEAAAAAAATVTAIIDLGISCGIGLAGLAAVIALTVFADQTNTGVFHPDLEYAQNASWALDLSIL